MEKLALFGGEKVIREYPEQLFKWPIITDEHKAAVLKVIESGKMSGWDITIDFENAFKKDFEREYALAFNNGTAAIQSGLYGMGVGAGDEVICPSITYWASILQVYSLRATAVFADIDPQTLCIDPDDIERCISERTKAIVVVHYAGYPADMDRIIAIAQKYNIKVFEDCSHAHSAIYKGKQIGTFGDAAGFSLMSGKSFAIGEGGMLTTDSREVYERAILFGLYERHGDIEDLDLKKYTGIPCGGYKYRMHQASSAFGLVQMKCYKSQFAEIDKAMSYFSDGIDGIDGITSHRPKNIPDTTKGGWYFPLAFYDSQKFGGLSVSRFVEALGAEGVEVGSGCNRSLHSHPVFNDMDIYSEGKPTRLMGLSQAPANYKRKLPVSESINDRIIQLPWFKHFDKDMIDKYVEAFEKVASNYQSLLADDKKTHESGGYSSAWKKLKK